MTDGIQQPNTPPRMICYLLTEDMNIIENLTSDRMQVEQVRKELPSKGFNGADAGKARDSPENEITQKKQG